ncbi:MAG: helix-turn-helix domain-containing protein [Candidatus Solibacter sp.]|jgi:excisionase family DNA binding protein
MANNLYFTTGQAAQQLGASQAQIRALCESGAIERETTSGGQYRIPASELARLQRDGLPAIPRPLPDESRPAARNGRTRHPELLAEPSSEVVNAVEEVTITERLLEKRKLEHALEEEEDWFRARADQQAQREAERREADRVRQNAADAQRRRRMRDNRWLRHAMSIVPWEARGQIEQEVHEQVQAALDRIRLEEPDAVARRVVDAIVAKLLKPWRRSKDLAETIEDARRSLPSGMRGTSWAPSTWESQATQAAARALEGVRPDASSNEMRAVAREAVKGAVAAFESHQAAVARASAEHQAAVAKASAEQRAKREAEERSKKDRDNRERLLRYPWVQFPYGMPDADQRDALTAAREAFAELPEGTPDRNLEAARDRAVKPFLDAHARGKEEARLESERQAQRRAAGMKADLQLDHIARYLDEEYDFDGGYSEMRREADRLRPLIREALIEELLENPGMTSDEIRESIEEQIDDGV